jgi:hypothetical protein
VKLDFWQTFRLFVMPFCVSSFSALVKGKGFILIFSPKPMEIAVAAGLCAILSGVVLPLRGRKRRLETAMQSNAAKEATASAQTVNR